MAGNKGGDIVIKKIKKVSGGHHGGAWKVAYADFVTAMMAFFLLLWLLSATTEEQKQGIAEYFVPTVGIRDSEGIGFKGGQSAAEDGIEQNDTSPIALVPAFSSPGQSSTKKEESIIDGDKESQLFEKAREEMKQAFESDPSLRELAENVLMEQTPEGLKIDIIDNDKHSMFIAGKAELSATGKLLVGKISKIIEKMPNHISVTGHTDSTPLNKGAYTNWELSADRANASRRHLIATGMKAGRMGKVVGMADVDPIDPEQPEAERNRRISVILLRGSHFTASTYLKNRPESLLSVPRAGKDLLQSGAIRPLKQEGDKKRPEVLTRDKL